MNIIKRFVIFFTICSLLPISVLWFYLYKENSAKLNERFEHLFETSKQLGIERLKTDLLLLKGLNEQAIELIIAEELQQYNETSQSRRLVKALNILQESKDLALVALYDDKGEVIASSDTFEEWPKRTVKKLLNLGLEGKSLNSIEKAKLDDKGKEELFYIAVSPLVDSVTQETFGVLLIGQLINESKSINKLKDSLSETEIKIEATPVKGWNSVELKNYFDETVGFLTINISRDLERGSKRKNKTILLTCLILVFIFNIVFAFRFYEGFILPINNVAKACHDVAEGDMNLEVDDRGLTVEANKLVTNFNTLIFQLKEKEQMRNKLISTLSHDLKTPLIAQGRAFDLMEAHKETKLDLIKALKTNNEHLLDMVSLLVETYKIDAKGVQLYIEEKHLSELINECLDKLMPIAESKNIEVQKYLQEGIEAQVDSAQLKRVLINIVGNALENIPEGSIVKVSLKEIKENLEITIADNGQGIDAKLLPKIFDRFFSLSGTKQKIGTGLGLYISRMIVEAHGGEISVDSVINEGTTFTIKLPSNIA